MPPRATGGFLPRSDYIRVPLFCSGLLALTIMAMMQAFPAAVTAIDWPLLLGAPAIMLAGLVYILIEFGCALVYAGAGHLLGQGSVSLRRQRWLDGVSGSAMVGLAGWLMLEKRPA